MPLSVSQSVSVVLQSAWPVRFWCTESFHCPVSLTTFSLNLRHRRFPYRRKHLAFPRNRLKFSLLNPSRTPSMALLELTPCVRGRFKVFPPSQLSFFPAPMSIGTGGAARHGSQQPPSSFLLEFRPHP